MCLQPHPWQGKSQRQQALWLPSCQYIPACRIYTTVMSEVYRPFQLNRQNMTYLIDDALFAFENRQQGLFRTMTLLLVVTALGFHLSWEKCELLPVQCGKFLGLVIDMVACQLSVPADKVQRVKESICTVQRQQQATSRQLAGIAGMLMLLFQRFIWHPYI